MPGLLLTVINAVYCTVIVPELCQQIGVNEAVFVVSSDDSGVASIRPLAPNEPLHQMPFCESFKASQSTSKSRQGGQGGGLPPQKEGPQEYLQ